MWFSYYLGTLPHHLQGSGLDCFEVLNNEALVESNGFTDVFWLPGNYNDLHGFAYM